MITTITKSRATAGLQSCTISGLVDGIGKISRQNENHSAIHHMNNASENWLGLESIDKVMAAINDGWADGVDKVLKATDSIDIDLDAVCIKRRRRRADFGDEIDIQRVYCGDIDRAWETTTRSKVSAPKQLTLNFEIGGSCNVSPDVMFWRGAAIVYLADKLTLSGFSVAINAACAFRVKKRGAVSGVTIPVKSHDEPLSMPSLASTACLAGFFRSAIFCHILRNPFQVRGNMGAALAFDDYYKDESAISGFSVINNKQQAIQFITSTLSNLKGNS